VKRIVAITIAVGLGLSALWFFVLRPAPATRGEKTVEELIRGVQNAASEKRLAAIQALGRMRSEDAVDELLRILPDSRPEIRMALIATLAQIASPKAAVPMEILLQEDEWQVRKATVEVLGEIRAPVSVPVLGAALLDPHPSVSMAAAAALSGMGEPALDALRAAVEGPDAVRRRAELAAARKALADAANRPAPSPPPATPSKGRQKPDEKGASPRKPEAKGVDDALARRCEELQTRYYQVGQSVAYALGRMNAPGTVPLLRQMLSDSAPLVRLAAAEALCLKPDPEAAEALVPLLDDPDQGVRFGIVKALPNLGDAAVPLFMKLASGKQTNIRYGAVKFLSKTKDPRRLPVLFAAQGDPETCVRDAARAALVREPKEQLVALAAENLRDPASPTRRQALELLAETSDPRAADALAAVLRDADAAVSSKAAELLGARGDRRGAESIARMLADSNLAVRFSAAERLAQWKDARGADVLLEIVRGGFDDTNRADAVHTKKKSGEVDTKQVAEAMRLLGQLGDKRVADFAVLGVQKEMPGLFHASAEALGTLKDPRAFDLLAPLVLRPGLVGRDHIVIALGYLGDPRAVDLLVQLVGRLEGVIAYRLHSSVKVVGDYNPAARSQDRFDNSLGVPIADALAHLGGDQAVKTIVAIVESTPSHKVAWLDSLCKIMGEMGDPRFVKPLAKLLLHDCPEPPVAAMLALKKMGPKAAPALIAELQEPGAARHSAVSTALADLGAPAADPLLAALQDREPAVRHGAAWALGQMGEPRAVEPLLGMLSDTNDDARASAAWALGQLKTPRAFDPLIQLAGSTQAMFRAAAAEALGLLGDRRAAPSLEALAQDKDPRVVRAARKALQAVAAPGEKAAVHPDTNATVLPSTEH